MLGKRLFVAAAFVVAAGALALEGTAEASCGLDYCPVRTPDETKTSTNLRLQTLVRFVDFSLSEGDGSYQESMFRFEFLRFRNWNLGAWVAPVRLVVQGETHYGLTNPVLFAERSFDINPEWSVSAATQLEIPMADSHDGIASSHTELLPYLGVAYTAPAFTVQLQSGVSLALSESHDHGPGNTQWVNPHDKRQALSRLALTLPLLKGRLQPGIRLNSRYTLNESRRQIVTSALVANYQLAETISLVAQAELPLTSERQFDWRSGAGLAFHL